MSAKPLIRGVGELEPPREILFEIFCSLSLTPIGNALLELLFPVTKGVRLLGVSR
jgi:hypothetical protein